MLCKELFSHTASASSDPARSCAGANQPTILLAARDGGKDRGEDVHATERSPFSGIQSIYLPSWSSNHMSLWRLTFCRRPPHVMLVLGSTAKTSPEHCVGDRPHEWCMTCITSCPSTSKQNNASESWLSVRFINYAESSEQFRANEQTCASQPYLFVHLFCLFSFCSCSDFAVTRDNTWKKYLLSRAGSS